jgi:hypothetical protein
VPQLGRPLQTAPTAPPGSPTMMYVSPYANALTPGMYESAAAYAAGALGREATRQQEAKKQWEREHPPTPPGVIPTPGEGGAGPLGGSEGWVCQDAFETDQEVPGCPAIEEISEAESGSLNAHVASVLGVAEEIGKELSHGVNAAAKFMGRNAARFADILSKGA